MDVLLLLTKSLKFQSPGFIQTDFKLKIGVLYKKLIFILMKPNKILKIFICEFK